jgi:predicted GNAT superfamily acetyltransferase
MTSATERETIVIREINSIAEIRAVEELQIEVWGDDERDVVPLSQLVAACYVGGSLIGAFDGEKLVGFVYGFPGHLQGRMVHHSHMLAVLPSYRNHNLAYRLKLAQRSKVMDDNLTDRITWTFDPLQSLNAYFNFAKLGVVSDTYKVNVYGEAGASFLHRNGTDRFFVTWLINSGRVGTRLSGKTMTFEKANCSRVLTNSDSGAPVLRPDATSLSASDPILIEIPLDINSIENSNFELAREWREVTRLAFSDALSSGFIVTEYLLKDGRTGNYLLEKMRVDDIP